MTDDTKFAKRLARCTFMDEYAGCVADIRLAERERCIAAMVASQPEGMRAVMEQRYREIMEVGK